MSKVHNIEYVVRVYTDEDDGSLWAEVLELPGCFASGFSLDELRDALAEAISLYVTDDPDAAKITSLKKKTGKGDEGKPARPAMQVGEMRVKVPA